MSRYIEVIFSPSVSPIVYFILDGKVVQNVADGMVIQDVIQIDGKVIQNVFTLCLYTADSWRHHPGWLSLTYICIEPGGGGGP